MSPRILGYAVLVYAAFTSGTVLDLVRITLGPWNGGWWVLGNTALWLAFVSGGFGLIFRKSWSRLVLLFGAAVSVVQGIVAIVFLSGLDIPLEAVLFNALAILPPVAILVGTLSLPPPAAWHTQPTSGSPVKRVVSLRIHLAYGCFAWIALVLCAIPLMSVLPLEFTTKQVLGMLIGIPVALATLAAGLAAVVLSIIEWREWPLITMSAASISMLLMFFAEDEWKIVGGNFALAWYIFATSVLLFFCVRWFALTRRRGMQTQETDARGP